MPDVRMIAAIGLRGQLGLGGKLPWCKEVGDRPWFRQQTLGHVVVIGDRTFRSISDAGRLTMASDRTIYRVQTRWYGDGGGPLEPEEIIRQFWGRVIFVAGGAKIYAAFAPFCLQTVSALLAFGLLEDQGSGDARKVRITELGFRALEDNRPGAKDAALREAALRPKLIAEYANLWKDGRPADPICISELRIERGFTEDGARSFLRVFDDTVGFTKAGSPDIVPDKTARAPDPEGAVQTIKVGDFVQWTSNGSDQFNPPQKVVEILPDGTHARVLGSLTGIPMSELSVVAPPKEAKPLPSVPVSANSAHAPDNAASKSDVSVLMRGNRLEISANVDAQGLDKLREMLEKYGEILKLMN